MNVVIELIIKLITVNLLVALATIIIIVVFDLRISPFSNDKTRGREWWASRPKWRDYF